jgi:hypothetical protein
MTYGKLLTDLKSLTEEQLEMDVTSFEEGEYYPIELVLMSTGPEADVLDANHPFFLIEEVYEEMSDEEAQEDPFWTDMY